MAGREVGTGCWQGDPGQELMGEWELCGGGTGQVLSVLGPVTSLRADKLGRVILYDNTLVGHRQEKCQMGPEKGLTWQS